MVRIWRVPCSELDRQHLLGEHAELHCIHGALAKSKRGEKGGYQRHPQTLRFKGHEGQLFARHCEQVYEMKQRGYNHRSPLEASALWEPYSYSLDEWTADAAVLEARKK